LFSGLRLTRIADLGTLPVEITAPSSSPEIAPEIRSGGIASATSASDVFSICESLKGLFKEENDISNKVIKKLLLGCAEKPADRPVTAVLAKDMSDLVSKLKVTSGVLPHAKYWDEGTEVNFGQSKYRVIAKLGSGGWGTTFKVVELDKSTDEEYGTYVAKAIHTELEGNSAIRAHKKNQVIYNSHLHVFHSRDC